MDLSSLLLTGVVQPDGISVKINNTNIYPIYYLSLSRATYIPGLELIGDLEVAPNIKIGTDVMTPDNRKGLVHRIEKEKVYIQNIDDSFNILSLRPSFSSVVFIPIRPKF